MNARGRHRRNRSFLNEDAAFVRHVMQNPSSGSRRHRLEMEPSHCFNVMGHTAIKIEPRLEAEISACAGIIHDAAVAGAETVIVQPAANLNLRGRHHFPHSSAKSCSVVPTAREMLYTS